MTNTMMERLRDRRGVALPLALTGLVVVSLLVTSAMLTGSTEAAISSAQSSGTRSLYDAEGGLQQYLRQQLANTQGLTAGVGTMQVNGRTVRVTRVILADTIDLPNNQRRLFASVLAEPMDRGQARGRAVVALVRQLGTFNTMNLNVNEGAVVGSSLEVGGNSKVIDKSTQCADTVGAGAVLHADGTTVTTKGSGKISGAVRESDKSGEEFEDYVLGDKTLLELAQLADIKFGALFGEAAFPTSAKATATSTDPRMRWGCPLGMGITCPDTLSPKYWPIVAIDAGGGAVDLQGDYGQGIIIVLNGGLKISGNFVFKGILLIDGHIDMTGTGGQTGSKIEGSVVAFGNNEQDSRVDESETSGNAVISYNRCAVNAAQNAFNERARQNPVYAPPTVAFGWSEVVR